MSTLGERLTSPIRVKSILLAFALAAVLGGTVGIVQGYAETRTGLYILGAGNVGTAKTIGWTSGGTKFAYGGSSSTVTLYYLYAGVRVWHFDEIETQAASACNWCSSRQTSTVSWVRYGDPAATRSAFRYSSSSGSSIYYTSWPDYSASCYAYWNSGAGYWTEPSKW